MRRIAPPLGLARSCSSLTDEGRRGLMTVPIGEITPVDRISRSLLSALESGANVLDGPLSALRHLVGLVMDDPSSPKLSAGEIVSARSPVQCPSRRASDGA